VQTDGLTVGVNAALGRSTAYASYALQDAKDGLTGTRLTNSPTNIAKAGLSAAVAPGVLAGVEVRYETSRLTVYGTETDPYVWTGLHLLVGPGVAAGKAGPGSILRSWRLSLAVSNLFDTRYSLPGGFEHRQAAIQQDGRTVTLQLRARW
jgi:outer membrane receptor protein involved in Fe transport